MMFHNHEFESIKLDTTSCQERQTDRIEIGCRVQQSQYFQLQFQVARANPIGSIVLAIVVVAVVVVAVAFVAVVVVMLTEVVVVK